MKKRFRLTNVASLIMGVVFIFPLIWIQACKPSVDKDEARIDSLLSVMTLEEKIAMVHRNSMFSSAGIERLGIPEVTCMDGPTGVREETERNSWNSLHLTTDSATFFPSGSALAATWNYDMAYKLGLGLGEETWTRGKDIILGPAVNITRTPVNGRTYEYLSEDPLLNSRIAVGYIKGVQSTGVAACIKHYALNNQETNRGRVSVEVSERALREIYLPSFKAAIEEADVKCIMSAYNKFRGQYCGENKYLLTDVAKNEFGFKGFIMSDWGGTHSTVDAALNGLDVEMGSEKYFAQALLDSVKSGRVPVSVIDDKVRRVLRVKLYCMKTKPAPANSLVSTPEHAKIAYEVASQSIVLLKNQNNALPLDAGKINSIAVIGDNATCKQQSGGFGAGVKARFEITPLEGLQKKVGKKVNIDFAQGYEAKFEKNKTGWGWHAVNEPNQKLVDEAVAAAKKADVAIVFCGTNRNFESEAFDRKDITLPFGQDELIKAVIAANPRTIVVVVAGAPVGLQTVDSIAPAIVYSWFNGSEGGSAVADVLFGNVNPSGKLPFSLPAKLEDSPAHALNAFPGDSVVTYTEGIFVGYRWFDTKNINPTFCFGHGLSYTQFDYSTLSTNKQEYASDETIEVSFKLKNIGDTDGLEVAQLYVSDMDPKVEKAAKELKAFAKVNVDKGAEVPVTLKIKAGDLAYFDENTMKWVVTPGKYKIQVGSSSRDIRLTSVISVK